MPCLDFTELSPLQKLQFLIIRDTCYYFNQERGDFFDRIGKTTGACVVKNMLAMYLQAPVVKLC
jgi:hypothetical protein